MRRFRFLAIFLSACLTVVTLPLLRRALSLALCGLLFANSSICYDVLGSDSVRAAVSGAEQNSVPERVKDRPQEIAIPPIIRPPSAELPRFIPDDFIVSRQTPYDSGRNEIIVTSPSSDAVQRFWVNLPGEAFQIYELEVTNIPVNNAEDLIEEVNAQTTPAEVQQRLQSFKADFSNNSVSKITLADDTTAEFSATQVVIRQPDGRVAETITRSQSSRIVDIGLAQKSQRKIDELLAQANSDCESNASIELVESASTMKSWSAAIASGWSPDIDWQDALATRLIYQASAALAHTLKEATSGSVALQKVMCKEPVQCGFRRDTRADGISGNQIITDLFQVPPGSDGQFHIVYEFFEIPDRLEISYNGEIKRAFGPESGDGNYSFELSGVEQGFVGIRVIGNPDQNTEWWYEISCSCSTEIASIANAEQANENAIQSEWDYILRVANEFYESNANNSAVSAFAYQMRTLATGSYMNRAEAGGWAGEFTRGSLLVAMRDIEANPDFWSSPPPTNASFSDSSSSFLYYCENAPDITSTDPNETSLRAHDCGFVLAGEHHFDRHLVPAFRSLISERLSAYLGNSCIENLADTIVDEILEIELEHSMLLNSVLIPGLDVIPNTSFSLDPDVYWLTEQVIEFFGDYVGTISGFAGNMISERAIKLRQGTIKSVLQTLLQDGEITQGEFDEISSRVDLD